MGRRYTKRELLAAFGYPCYAQLAEAAGVPEYEHAPSSVDVGNCMNVASVGIALLVAMACTRLK